MTPLTDTERPGYYFASFSPEAGYYVRCFPPSLQPLPPSFPTHITAFRDARAKLPPLHSLPFSHLQLLTSSGGLSVPWQRIVKLDSSPEDFDYLLEDNHALNQTLTQFLLPNVNYATVTVDGYELNVKEIRPVGMDESGKTKYPVLLAVSYCVQYADGGFG